jgi:hypothetical protein
VNALAGLPWTTWLLLIASIGIGLSIELRFWIRRRSSRRN